jgi:hypothetical protein
LSVWAALVAGILLIPFLGKWPWSTGDYVFGGVVLFGSATLYEFITRKMKNRNHRIITGVLLGLAVLAIWAMAVAD